MTSLCFTLENGGGHQYLSVLLDKILPQLTFYQLYYTENKNSAMFLKLRPQAAGEDEESI